MKRLLTILALATFVSAPTQAAQIWSEEFNFGDAPDPNTWSYDLGSWGWGNQELQNYTSSQDNVRVEGGHLVITARQVPGGFTSARIKTQDKFTFQYGTVEARIKVPDVANGLWPAFWTLGNNFSSVGWPHCGEIDVLEMGSGSAIGSGVQNRKVYSTAHWQAQGGYANYGQSLIASQDLSQDFHIWRMEWTPNYIATFLDGQQIWVIDISNPSSFSGEEFHKPHFFILNLAVGGTFTGIFNQNGITADLPAEYRIDYVRLYDNGHTILSPIGTPYCLGDIPSCPCGNGGHGVSGCGSSTGNGATLDALGSESVSANNLTLRLRGGLPGQPCLFFQGENRVNNGAGVPLGDGLRCAGSNVVRLQVLTPDAQGEANTTISVASKGGVSIGNLRHYQVWYRDNGISCGSGFNTTNGYSLLWTP